MHICHHQIVSCKTCFFLSIGSFISSEYFYQFEAKNKSNLPNTVQSKEWRKDRIPTLLKHCSRIVCFYATSMFYVIIIRYLQSTYYCIPVQWCGTCFAVYTHIRRVSIVINKNNIVHHSSASYMYLHSTLVRKSKSSKSHISTIKKHISLLSPKYI